MNNKSFTLIEALIYIFVFSLLLTLVFSFLIWIFNYNLQTQSRTTDLVNFNFGLNFISEKTKSADSIYYPTTSSLQLSLEVKDRYIDFYLKENKLYFKEEFKEPIVLAPNIDELYFEFIGESGVKIKLNNLNNTIFLR